jgi:hypothetical protein
MSGSSKFLNRLLDLFDDKISARADAAARARGHSVRKVPGTRIKVYRNDALWDLVRELDEIECHDDVESGEDDHAAEDVAAGDLR